MAWNSGRELTRWPRATRSGYVPFLSLYNDINRLFDDVVPGIVGSGAPAKSDGNDFVPRLNVTEDESSIKVTAELPGMDEKDVEVHVNHEALTIRGEKRYERDENEKGTHIIERRFGMFERVIPLACEVDQDAINATFKKGLLEVTLQKSKQAKNQSKKITIKAA